jgi:hypothetical protein
VAAGALVRGEVDLLVLTPMNMVLAADRHQVELALETHQRVV